MSSYVGRRRAGKTGPPCKCEGYQYRLSSVNHNLACPVYIEAAQRLKLGQGGTRPAAIGCLREASEAATAETGEKAAR